ncbi:hypothetical protein N7519_008726 [Penicillium mononematosum]|uniref:uncharacterized protein n=1 Tax=Penicillium mononematosum TaxID=268346 RepID=UPI0025499B0F|nr:uncharacterized protein N7519_008726 [Penicillium mononematosum]KAJ6178265.1 hypothetical protein N7519_008726 [Penicillium mononematosum]
MLARTITGDLDQCNLSIAEFEGLLMDNSWCGADNSQFRNISVFGLYAVLCGFPSIIFSAHATGTIQRQLQVIERALSRWKLIWDLLISQTPSEELERVGIMMSADEVWLLGKVFLRMDPKDFLEGLDSDSMEDIESLVNRMKKTVARSGR